MPSHRLSPRQIVGTLAAALPLIAGCSLPALLAGHGEPPSVTLQSSAVESLSPSTAVVRFALAVSNPNTFGLTVQAIGCRLRCGDQVLAQGGSSVRVTLPARATSIVEVRMNVPFPALSGASPEAMMLGEVPYDLDGKLRFGSFVAERELLFALASVLRISPPVGLASLPGPRPGGVWLRSPPEAGTPAPNRNSP